MHNITLVITHLISVRNNTKHQMWSNRLCCVFSAFFALAVISASQRTQVQIHQRPIPHTPCHNLFMKRGLAHIMGGNHQQFVWQAILKKSNAIIPVVYRCMCICQLLSVPVLIYGAVLQYFILVIMTSSAAFRKKVCFLTVWVRHLTRYKIWFLCS